MIVIDSSAIIAILLDEPERNRFQAIVEGEDACLVSAVNAHETVCVMRARYGVEAVERVWRFFASSEIEIVPFDEVEARAAAAAYLRFGKGVHPARLNLADCAAYALAKSRDAPLLFKGDDFPLTDVRRL